MKVVDAHMKGDIMSNEKKRTIKVVALYTGVTVGYVVLCWGAYKLLGKVVAREVVRELPKLL